MKISRFSDTQIIAILKQAKAGAPIPELCREHDISTTTLAQPLNTIMITNHWL